MGILVRTKHKTKTHLKRRILDTGTEGRVNVKETIRPCKRKIWQRSCRRRQILQGLRHPGAAIELPLRRVDSHRLQKRRPRTSAICGTYAGQLVRERSDLAEDPLRAWWLPSEPSWPGWQRLAGTLSWAGKLTRGGSDRGVFMGPKHPDWECTTPSVRSGGGVGALCKSAHDPWEEDSDVGRRPELKSEEFLFVDNPFTRY